MRPTRLKPLILALVTTLCLIAPARAQAAYTYLGTVGAMSANSVQVTTAAQNTTGADLIVIFVADYQGVTLFVPIDSNGNTYTIVQSYSISTSTRGTFFFCFNPTVGSGHTFTYPSGTSTNMFPTIEVMWFSGSSGSTYDVNTGNTTTAGTTVAPGSGTPAHNNEVVISAVNFAVLNDTVSISPGSFTLTDQQPGVSAEAWGAGIAYSIQTSATAANPTWTAASSTNMAAAMVSFQGTAGGSTFPAGILNVPIPCCGESWIARPWSSNFWPFWSPLILNVPSPSAGPSSRRPSPGSMKSASMKPDSATTSARAPLPAQGVSPVVATTAGTTRTAASSAASSTRPRPTSKHGVSGTSGWFR